MPRIGTLQVFLEKHKTAHPISSGGGPVVNNASMSFATPANVGFVIGKATATNSPTSWSVSTNARSPQGNTVNNSTQAALGYFAIRPDGTITCNAADIPPGVYSITVAATNAAGTGFGTITLTATTIGVIYYVNNITGNDLNNGLTPGAAFATLTKANTVANAPGATVLVAAGTYTVPVGLALTNSGALVNGAGGEIPIPIWWAPYQGGQVILDGTGVNTPAVIKITGNYVTLTGFIVQNGKGQAATKGILVSGTIGCRIVGNLVQQNNDTGIRIDNTGAASNFNTVLNNVVTANCQNNLNHALGASGWGQGIASIIATLTTIQNNVCFNNWGEGLYVDQLNFGTVASNVSYDNYNAQLLVNNTKNTGFSGNLIYSTGSTIWGFLSAALPAGVMMERVENVLPLSALNFTNNIIIGTLTGFGYTTTGSGGGFQGCNFLSNTVVNCTAPLNFAADAGTSSNLLGDNIFYGGTVAGSAAGFATGPSSFIATPGVGSVPDGAGNVYSITAGGVMQDNLVNIPGGAGTDIVFLTGGVTSPPPPLLTQSGPITITANNQLVTGLQINATSGDAIRCSHFSGVQIIGNVIHHTESGCGINADNSPNLIIQGNDILKTDSPATGANASPAPVNILLSSCASALVGPPNSGTLSAGTPTNAELAKGNRLTNGSSGIYSVGSNPGPIVNCVEGHNFRGPFPRGQVVQYDSSPNGSISNFSCKNDLAISWTEDTINIFGSNNTAISWGILDGNNSPSGDGVIVEHGAAGCTCDHVDVINWGNGGFGTASDPGFLNASLVITNCRLGTWHANAGRGIALSANNGTTAGLSFAANGPSTSLTVGPTNIYSADSQGSFYGLGNNLAFDTALMPLHNPTGPQAFTPRPLLNLPLFPSPPPPPPATQVWAHSSAPPLIWYLYSGGPTGTFTSQGSNVPPGYPPTSGGTTNCWAGGAVSGGFGGGAGDILADPKFVQPAGLFVAANYFLQPSSPCIGAGSNYTIVGFAQDFSNNQRSSTGKWTIGAQQGPFVPNGVSLLMLPNGYMSSSGSKIVMSTGPNLGQEVKWTGGVWSGGEESSVIGSIPAACTPFLDNTSYRAQLNQCAVLGINMIRWAYCDLTLDDVVPFITAVGANPVEPFGINVTLNPDLALLPRNGANQIPTLIVWDAILKYARSLGIRVYFDHHWQWPGQGNSNNNPGWWDSNEARAVFTSQPQFPYTQAKVLAHAVLLATRYSGNDVLAGMEGNNEVNSGFCTWGNAAASDLKLWYELHGNSCLAVNPDLMFVCMGMQVSFTGVLNTSTLNFPNSAPPVSAYNVNVGHFAGGDLSFLTGGPNSAGVPGNGAALMVNLTVPNKVIYGIHTYGPTVDATTIPQQASTWNSAFGFLYSNNVAPILIDEFGTGPTELLSPPPNGLVAGDNDSAWWTNLSSGGGITGWLHGNGIAIPVGRYGPSFAYFNLNSVAEVSAIGSDFSLLQANGNPVAVLYNPLAPSFYTGVPG